MFKLFIPIIHRLFLQCILGLFSCDYSASQSGLDEWSRCMCHRLGTLYVSVSGYTKRETVK